MKRIIFGAFISGMVLMIFEMVGARMIGPYFGTSMYVWSSIIGVILASLSLGYWYGGKRADLESSIKEYASIFLLAAISMVFVLLLKEKILGYIFVHFKDIRIGAILSGIMLFSIPSFFFGIISPYAIKLSLKDINDTGKTSGNIYALSTIGSILGTFLGGFLLVPLFGINSVLCICIALMCITSLILIFSNYKKSALILFFSIGFTLYSNAYEIKDRKTYISEYSNISVIKMIEPESNREVKNLLIDNQYASSMYIDDGNSAHQYLKYYRLDSLLKPNFKKTLMLGGAACSYPKELILRDKNVTVDIVEIDKKLIEIAHEEFDLPYDDRFRYFYEDGRTFLNRNKEKYDIIYGDAFNSHYAIPFQLTTIEAIQLMYNSLEDDGMLMGNIISLLNNENNKFLRAELATYKELFDFVYVFQVDNEGDINTIQNFCVIASKVDLNSDSQNVEIRELMKRNIISNFPELEILTDNKAPVEMYISSMY